MRIKIKKLMDGPGPGEALVEVTTIAGSAGSTEQVIVHHTVIENDMIDVGNPIHEENDRVLVELPREAMSGNWRVWVPRQEIAPQ